MRIVNYALRVILQAGIPRKQLLLVSEPEAATIYCNHIPMEAKPDGRGRTETNLFEPGTQYMVLDAGGQKLLQITHSIKISNKTV